jgi:hypothetical protein
MIEKISSSFFVISIPWKTVRVIITLSVLTRGRHNLIGSDRLFFDQIRSGFSNLRSDQVFEIVDPIKFDLIRFLKLSIRSSSIRSGFQNLRSDKVRSDQVFEILDPIKFDPIRFFKSYADPWCLQLIGIPMFYRLSFKWRRDQKRH